METFKTKKELFEHLVKNKEILIAQKKATMKRADGITVGIIGAGKSFAHKAGESDTLQRSLIINTTKVHDSHGDVHIDGLWNKSVSENKNIMHLQEHDLSFKSIIADGADLKAYTKQFSFKELGFPFNGTTEALVFDSNISKERNPYMFEQYSKNRVKNHSVGMVYVKLILCIKDEDYGAEYEAWEKYFPQILVKEDVAEQKGYFWAVTEAKVVEGSAVPIGSNQITPTLQPKEEPPSGTPDTKPPSGTLDLKKMSKYFIN